jgi:iron complex transport system substrate-binding protein
MRLGRVIVRAKTRFKVGAVLLLALSFACSAMRGAPPQRIVSLSPDVTEMLYGIGAFSRVVAVSNYDTYPPQVANLPHIGQLHNPDFEKLTALRPDLVILNEVQAQFFEDTLNQLGFRVLKISNRSIAEVYTAMTTLGRATGNESDAARLIAATRESLDRTARKTAGLPKPRVVLTVDRTPGTLRDLYTATEGSYLAELVEIAGGRIALPAAAKGYAKLSKEDLLAANPDVILDFVQGAKGRFAGDPLEAWQEMPELKAMHDHRIYSVDQDFVPHASQRIVQTAELFAKLIHPEIQ